jgi:serine/threonine protein kinase
MPLLLVKTLVRQVLVGLSFIHSADQQIIHTDLKPENILLSTQLPPLPRWDAHASNDASMRRTQAAWPFPREGKRLGWLGVSCIHLATWVPVLTYCRHCPGRRLRLRRGATATGRSGT